MKFCSTDQNKQREIPAGIYLFKDHNENTKAMSEISSKLTIKALGDIIDIDKVWCLFC